MWKNMENHFAAFLNSSKNCESGKFVKQNINSHGNYEGIDDFMCNSFKIKSLPPKPALDRVDGNFANHSFYAD